MRGAMLAPVLRGKSLLIKVGLPGAGTSARCEQPSIPCLIKLMQRYYFFLNQQEI